MYLSRERRELESTRGDQLGGELLEDGAAVGGGVESWRQGPEYNPERTEMDSEGFGLDGSGRAQMWLSS